MRAPAVFVACLASLLSLPCAAPGARAEDAPKEPPAPGAGKDEPPNRDKTRGYVCIQWGLAQLLTPEQREESGVTLEKGIFISAVTPDGPADRAGLRVGDVPISFAGHPVPDAKDLPADGDAFAKFLKEKTKPMADTIDPGTKVEVVVDRAGKRLTFSMVAVDATKADELATAAQQETWAVKVPRPEGRADPVAATLDFQKMPDGASVPAQFLPVTGYWEVTDDQVKPGNKVVVQGTEETGYCVGLVVADGRVYGDGTAKTKFLLMKGERSASAGIVVRAQDRRSYYVARVDGVTQDLAIVRMERNEPKVLATVPVKSPKLGTWHTLTVTAKGAKLTATLDDGTSVSAEDPTFTAGWSGLATSLDAVTAFDDLELTPATK